MLGTQNTRPTELVKKYHKNTIKIPLKPTGFYTTARNPQFKREVKVNL